MDKKNGPPPFSNLSKIHIAIIFLFLLGLGLGLRFYFACQLEHPGWADYSFYYSLADSIASGKGLYVDYIWNYLSKPTSIPHYANDFWVPMTSLIIAPFFYFFGTSVPVALIPSILLSGGLFCLTYKCSQDFRTSIFLALTSGAFVLFDPGLFGYSLATDSVIYYSFFAGMALYFMVKKDPAPSHFLWATVFIALAYLTRNDGLLLLPILLLVLGVSSLSKKEKIQTSIFSLGLFGLLISPLLIYNYTCFGSPFPPGPSKVFFFREYRDLYSYSGTFNLSTYLEWGWSNILYSKWNAARENLAIFEDIFSRPLLILFIIASIDFVLSSEKRERWKRYYPCLLFFLCLFGFHTLVATFTGPGSFNRSLHSLYPFMAIFSLDTFETRLEQLLSSWKIPLEIPLAIGCLVFLLYLGHKSIEDGWNTKEYREKIQKSLLTVKETVEASSSQEKGKIRIMARSPWDLHVATGYVTLQIPHEEKEVIFQVARKFKVTHILLASHRPSLEKIYQRKETHSQLRFLKEISHPRSSSPYRLFEFTPSTK